MCKLKIQKNPQKLELQRNLISSLDLQKNQLYFQWNAITDWKMKFIITFTMTLKHQLSRNTSKKNISYWKQYTTERVKDILNKSFCGLDL